MSRAFDYDAFLRRSLSIIAHARGKSFARVTRELDALGQEYEGIRDSAARKYIRRDLDRRLLMIGIETSRPPALVDRLYNRNVRRGFNELHAEVASAIEYADYCREHDNGPKALRVLLNVRKRLGAKRGIASGFLRTIEESIRRLEKPEG